MCPLADTSLLQLLGERRYIVLDHMNVYTRHIDALEDKSPSQPDVSIHIATPDEAGLWFEQDSAIGDWAEPDGLAFMLIRCTLKSLDKFRVRAKTQL